MGDGNKQGRHLRALPSSGTGSELKDMAGQPLPLSPRVGFDLLVTHAAPSFELVIWRVRIVNSRSFYVRARQARHRFLLEEWEGFLRERLAEGRVRIINQPRGPSLLVVP